MNLETLTGLYRGWIARDRPVAVYARREGKWVPISAREFDFSVRALSSALVDTGLRPGDRVAILMENRPEWHVVDFATLAAGGVVVPIYPSLTADQVAYILRDSGASFVFCSTPDQLAKVVGIREQCPELLLTIVADPAGELPREVGSLAAMIERGRPGAELNPAVFDQRLAARKADDLATLIYTSGTTSEPKGVMLSHGNLSSNVEASLTCVPFAPDWIALSFLPLSHVYERMVDYCYMHAGAAIAYLDDLEQLPVALGEIQPYVFVSVPRVYEKIHAKVMAAAAASPIKRLIFGPAVRIAGEWFEHRQQRTTPPLGLRLRWALFDRLVYGKIRARLGKNFRIALSGGAPLAPELARFFLGMNITVVEGYGLTETSPVLTANTPEDWKVGTVGKPIPGVELRIAEDGEILARGPGIMKGYWNKPKETAAVLLPGGWFATGDIGKIDEQGFLVITDRKKELIVDAYGKNVAPQPIENLLKIQPFITQAIVVGDRRPFLVALVVPNFERLRAWAGTQGLVFESDLAAATHPEVHRLIQADVDRVNEQLARYEQIKRFSILPRELTQQTGELTPTQKIKRRVIASSFAAIIEELYEGHET